MDVILLTGYQAVQLLALGPCLFMAFFLCVTTRKFSQVIVPLLYFLSLACSFVLPMLDVLGFSTELQGALLLGESLTPSLSFLLIVQFIGGRVPPFIYWAILAVPIVGGSSIVYATLIAKGEVCVYEHVCTEPLLFKQLYTIFSASLTFLLTVAVYNRLVVTMEGNSAQRQHKYAIVVSLVVLNLVILAIDLAQLGGHVTADRAELAVAVVRIGFIYLVLTSVFRVFDHSVEIDYERVPHIRPSEPNAKDTALSERIKLMLADEKIYRSMDLSREKLASKLAVSEHTLSRVINQCFGQNFNAFVNQYRVEEAKERLVREETAITVIGFEVGFSSIPSFNRVFKQTAGVSPSEYRATHTPKK